MRPGERVDHIRKRARTLSEQSDGEVRLVLGQFDIEAGNMDDFQSRDDYLLYTLGKASDADLQRLSEYLVPSKVGEVMAIEPPGLWQAGALRVFCSHRDTDKVLVSEVKKELADLGVDCFVAHQDIEPTKDWVETIELALRTCDALAAFLTEEFHASKWTDQEVGYCIQRGVPIVPVMLRATAMPYGFMARYQGLKCEGKAALGIASDVYDALISNPQTSDRCASSLVAEFERSTSFLQSFALMDHLEKVKSLTSEQIPRIESAVVDNDQVGRAYGVPARVKALVTRLRRAGLSR